MMALMERLMKITETDIINQLKTVIDPEMMVNVVDLGLIYRITVNKKRVEIDFTLTYPGCPVGPMIQQDIITAIKSNNGTPRVKANLIWDPPWNPERMSEEARITLGYPI
jgi:metal-sulfur cluster biosynthetic enzyme